MYAQLQKSRKNPITLKRESIIQKRNPEIANVDTEELTHGTGVKKFERDNPYKRPIPSPPAWFAISSHERYIEFNLHAAVRKNLPVNIGDQKEAYIHRYGIKNNIVLAMWQEWSHAAEYLARKEKWYQNILKHRNGKPEEVRENHIRADLKAMPAHMKYRLNGIHSAKLLEGHISGRDGYMLNKDMVRGEPEVILYQKGLNKLRKNKLVEYTIEREADTVTHKKYKITSDEDAARYKYTKKLAGKDVGQLEKI